MQKGQKSAVEPADAPASWVGLPSDVEPLEHLRRVVERQQLGWSGRLPLILTHRSPDPDALGAMVALSFLLRHAFGLQCETATTGRIFRAENRAMVRELNLHFEDYDAIDPGDFAGVFLVDTQPWFGHTPLPGGVPVIAVFDHHQPPPPEALEQRELPPHFDVRLGVGATSAVMYGYIRDAGLEMDPRTATAICCGVRFDTGDLSLHATPLDVEAFHESFRRADRKMLARINRPMLPPSYYSELQRSLNRARRHGPLVFGLLGRVRNPESVAEMADFFRRMEGCRWSLVGGAFEDNYHLSLRTDLAYGDAYPLMEAIVADEGSFGGRGPVAGGQIACDGRDVDALQGLERRLRARALALVDLSDLRPADPPEGTRLTRIT